MAAVAAADVRTGVDERAADENDVGTSVLWVTEAEAAADEMAMLEAMGARTTTVCKVKKVKHQLGMTFAVVVLHAHASLAPNALGVVQGLVLAGGLLVLRLPPRTRHIRTDSLFASPSRTTRVPTGAARLAGNSSPFARRFERLLARHAAAVPRVFVEVDGEVGGEALEELVASIPTTITLKGSSEQREVVAALSEALVSGATGVRLVVADRGRGKSAALGLALRAASEHGLSLAEVMVVGAGSDREHSEIAKFGPAELLLSEPEAMYKAASAEAATAVRAYVIDEAAQVPVSVLKALVKVHGQRALLIFATTVHGYEGTGRGFVIRFADWLSSSAYTGEVEKHTLKAPIRWDAGDSMEAFFNELLGLKVEPAAIGEADAGAILDDVNGMLEYAVLSHDELADNDSLLDEVFGLLVGAHYRTTPDDLWRLLDAPNMETHVLRERSGERRVVAVNVVAREGGFPVENAKAIARGKMNLRGHVLVDIMAKHLGCRAAPSLVLVRSVRTAVVEVLRRGGLATLLIEKVHSVHADADAFGTLFGATAGLVAFRHGLGYHAIRLSATRGVRAGEPSIAMMRAMSPEGEAVLAHLRKLFGFGLSKVLSLASVSLARPVAKMLLADAPTSERLEPDLLHEVVAEVYAHGAAVDESVMAALAQWLSDYAASVDAALARGVIKPNERALLTARVLDGLDLGDAAAVAGMKHGGAAAKSLRQVFRRLVEAVREESG
ncbi:small heat shock protein [Thecamonas trahens ATCC 50062]|uniref:Small heat shock protein n=1 Tax=Thecamonas trahens ATCC 50062 TaxID=461836 RepID=A0A0L0DT97_THETB|nr:small heat shock protein [Thecamonas trahens ATCC 50062]KNC55266.1 small heat shock protein [Thecamonas trahens ATCC 50062]|eukprot:XP_013753089.1 small heat shock protein [Thecamonas trahens ATCC 50062]